MPRPIEMSRRTVLAGALLAGFPGGARARAAQAQPASGLDLPDIPDLPLERRDGVASGRLPVERVETEMAGLPVTILGYGGRFPGPLIRLRHDETLAIAFENRLAEPTNLHTHGLAVSPRGDADNPFRHVAPGATAAYRIPLKGDPLNGGLFWYHPHLHGLQASQQFSGLAGPIVVDGPNDPGPLLGPHDERVIVLKDFRFAGREVALHRPLDWLMGLEGDLPLVNGALRPVLRARERRLRLRLVNASNARFWRIAAEDGRALTIIAEDGHTLEAPQPARAVTLAPAERLDVVLDLDGGEALTLLDVPVPRRGGRPRATAPLMRVVPPGGGRAKPDPLPARLTSRPAFDRSDIAERRRVDLSFFYINGRPMHGHHDAPMFRPRFGTREIWEIRNVDTMDHPFHLHTWPFRLLARNGAAVAGEPWRDTISLGPGETAEIGIDFSGEWGRSVFHCHIVEHAAKGMMAVLEVTR
ncbi:multicopper oxidase family protein [Faunimonas sp. B44]|uniref:multicopper oxidase family protein n=1 Tax=Faunimonas sp. B44 TaxID=3461493 RepID=UPI0040440183